MQKQPFFLPYQKKWILDDSRIKIMEKSRQIGMSWTTAYRLVRVHAANRGRPRDSWVSSRDELQARLFIRDCREFAKIMNIAVSEWTGSPLVSGGDCASLEFADGSRIWSMSSNPDAQAGKRGDRVLDEFALHPDPEKLYAISMPGITWGGNIEIISTHRGRDSFFNKLIEEARYGGNPKRMSLHRTTLQDALEQGLLSKLKAALPPDSEIAQMDEAQYFDFIKNSCADESMFLQEYMCVPSAEDERFLPFELIEKCVYAPASTHDAWRAPISRANPLYLGVDIGRTSDLTVFWLLEHSGDVLYTRDVKAFKNIPFAEQESYLHTYLSDKSLRRACIDNTGIGRQFAERALSRYGSARIEPVCFTQSAKELMAYPLKERFEKCQIRIPDDPDVIADLHKIKRTYGIGGGLRFTAERDGSGHSDRFWALALANHACQTSPDSRASISLSPQPKFGFIW